MTGRRGLVLAVLLCAAGAAVALLAAGRPWAVEVTVRPPPLPDLRTEQTGGALRPWLPACGWVALAGAGALVATRAAARRLVGGLLLVSGVGIAGATVSLGRGADFTAGWPVAAAAGGLTVAAAGAFAVARGDRWPAMGARYERTRPDQGRETDLWRALDRGEDPTAQ
jgi:uncharacterized membrane protein (TIGR02234 family)